MFTYGINRRSLDVACLNSLPFGVLDRVWNSLSFHLLCRNGNFEDLRCEDYASAQSTCRCEVDKEAMIRINRTPNGKGTPTIKTALE